MTKKQYEMNNLLHNTEIALMNGNLPESEQRRLRQRQRDLRNNLRRAAEKPSLLSLKVKQWSKKVVLELNFSDSDRLTVVTANQWAAACITQKAAQEIWESWSGTKDEMRRAIERL
jgi:hypothetical protein